VIRASRTAILVSLGALTTGLAGVTAATAGAASKPTVLETRVIGHSVRGRPIRAYHVGNPRSANRVVVMATMHGDEPRTRLILRSIRDGRPVTGVNLWLIPVVNPDGLARDTRKNAHGVDLNRNFPYHWVHRSGHYASGTRAGSEPETRALMRFLRRIRPHRVVSFHQPLHGVDVSTPASRSFAKRLASGLDLPRKNLTCGGTCHGTFTEWYIHRYGGVAVTVEYGHHPSRHRMTVTAPRQLLHVLGGRR
jgi:murein peptide amidase A